MARGHRVEIIATARTATTMRGASRVRRAPLLGALVLCALVIARPASPQASADATGCDARLIPSRTDPLAYGPRGERCEGLYFLPVSGSAELSLVAFTEPVGGFTLKPDEHLYVQWAGTPGKVPVHIRAVSLRRRLYYRMDAVRPQGSDRFEWPADVVARLSLSGPELGVVTWVQQTVGARTENVYVPARLGKATEAGKKGVYVAQVVPGAELSELFVTLAAVGPDGRDQAYLKRDEPLKGFYPAERPISVTLSGFPGAGLYRLRLGAVLRGGGSATSTFVFYHPGN